MIETVTAPNALLAENLPDRLPITPVSGPIVGTVRVPGSKSITNRALVLAALADGPTTLTNALFADDTHRMMDCLRALGFELEADPAKGTITVHGQGGKIPADRAELFVGNSGTTARFITPLVALGHGEYIIDGVPRMRERPIGDLLTALQQLGVKAESINGNGCPPLRIYANGLPGGNCTMRADTSSQFLSGLLMAAPYAKTSVRILLEGPILSAPYIKMTAAMMETFAEDSDDGMTTQMMEAFGGVVKNNFPESSIGGSHTPVAYTLTVPNRYRYKALGEYTSEPDASSVSYFIAAAAITKGDVRIEGVSGNNMLQGDWNFMDVLYSMGCSKIRGPGFVGITSQRELEGGTSMGRGSGTWLDWNGTWLFVPRNLALQGGTFDMNEISDTVMTLAAVAPFADSPTVITNVAHIRHKETDRIHAVVTELRRLGVRVDEEDDGMTIYPTTDFKPAIIETYDDHRMAMAFALIGLRVPGVTIDNPACVAKTFPDYFVRLDNLVNKRTEVPA